VSRRSVFLPTLAFLALLIPSTPGLSDEVLGQAATSGDTPDTLLREYLGAMYGFGGYPYFAPDYLDGVYLPEAQGVLRRAVAQFPAHPATDLMIRHMRLLSDRAEARREECRRSRRVPHEAEDASRARVFLKRYRVADLVLPVPAKFVPSNAVEPATEQPSREADFDSLVELIKITVAPESWDYVGGPGSITPDEEKLTLAVRQTRRVHQRIGEMLADLRELSALPITLDVQFIRAPDDVVGPLLRDRAVRVRPPEAPEDERFGILCLLPPVATQLLEAAQREPRARVNVLPQITALNGQEVRIADLVEGGAFADVPLMVQAVTSGGRSGTRVTLGIGDWITSIRVPDNPLRCIDIPGGTSIVVDLTPPKEPVGDKAKLPPKRASRAPSAAGRRSPMRELIVVTPRLLIADGERPTRPTSHLHDAFHDEPRLARKAVEPRAELDRLLKELVAVPDVMPLDEGIKPMLPDTPGSSMRD
jgi:hypothetical protein